MRLRNNKGQFVIETVLMMMITIGTFMWAMNQLRDNKYLARLIGQPWQQISGMIESGVWGTPDTVRGKHPNQLNRSLTVEAQ